MILHQQARKMISEIKSREHDDGGMLLLLMAKHLEGTSLVKAVKTQSPFEKLWLLELWVYWKSSDILIFEIRILLVYL